LFITPKLPLTIQMSRSIISTILIISSILGVTLSVSYPMKASCTISPVSGYHVAGTITFTQNTENGPLTVDYDLNGLPASGEFAFNIENSTTSPNAQCSNVGSVLNPFNQTHGAQSSPNRRLGDFGNINSDSDGNATYSWTTDSVPSLANNNTIIGYPCVIHSKKDNFTNSATDGDSSAPMGCGSVVPQAQQVYKFFAMTNTPIFALCIGIALYLLSF
jgi:Cu-Zn family superoxide dismutase